ncbi:hypothetical protein L1049_004945 [Liquidambar formosana]|uniref:Pectinesterase inhibitor domain-containing protein n=1 Tax=Liquidambar formosana TaxID=63359 RepID=A0AAP0RPT5_LIQFO
MEPNNHVLLIISLSSLLLSSFSAEAICVPRNYTDGLPLSPPFSPPKHQPVHPSLPISSPPPPISFNDFFPSSSIDPAIKKVCRATDHPSLCFSTITPYLGGKTNPASILKMEIKACANQTKAALAMATKIANDPSTTSITAECLETCQENYSDAIDNLKSAVDAIATHDVGTMNSMLSAALTDFTTCEDGFAEMPGVKSPMAKFDDTLTKLASNCLAIVSLIH